ncbi:lipocalin family protein [Methylibium sp.]|jgi:apolipoprotein D and lipocalin family protein|uniref:lipocalin family protein n=1 Tax=Methylibium sp. TaxID=2067992 RepID=UPI003D0B6CB0
MPSVALSGCVERPEVHQVHRRLGPLVLGLAFCGSAHAGATPQEGPPPLQALPSLEVSAYMGTWYQVAWYPNRFQRQCVSDTRATYRLLEQGEVEVANQCRNAEGRIESIRGVAQAVGSTVEGQLMPAQLRVSFLPALIRWLPIGWGNYWVLALGPDGRYSLVSEPTREYLWVLSRTPQLTDDDDRSVRATLQAQGFDLARLERHPQTPAAAP